MRTMTKFVLHLVHMTPNFQLRLPLSYSRHYFPLFSSYPFSNTTATMPSSYSSSSSNKNNNNNYNNNKTLMDFFPLSNPTRKSKRLKTTSATTDDGSQHSVTPPLSQNEGPTPTPTPASSCLTHDQKLRMEFSKSLAHAKRNLSLCSQKLQLSQAEGGNGYVKLEELLVEESWLEALKGEFEKPYAKNLCKFVETEMCSGNLPIYPPQHLIFNALNSTPFNKVKAVILGQDPYHGPGQAMGLAFSVPEGIKIPSSLANIFKELKKDLGCSIPSHGNLERWTVQGVLLLNTVLTVRHHQANSHAKKGWEQFTDAVIRTISEKKRGVVFILWGNSAQEKSRLIDGNKHHILKSAHPSGLSANRGFFGCRHFSRTNQILEQIGESPIDWQL